MYYNNFKPIVFLNTLQFSKQSIQRAKIESKDLPSDNEL